MVQNASLLLTKAISTQPRTFTSAANKTRFESIVGCGPSDDYRRAYARWEQQIETLPGVTLAATFDVVDRVITGIGAENILESSIAVDRLWGMPVIPGSSLKGLASHYAVANAAAAGFTGEQLTDLFGDTEWAACVRWLDAWFDPDSTTQPFALDVVTVHHQSYYGDPSNPPVDFEDPVPSYFLTARGRFLVAVQAPDRDWAEAALELLRRALEQWGAGAKTNAGYGRLRLREHRTSWKADQVRQAQAAAEAEAVKQAEEEAIRTKREKERSDKEAAEQAYREKIEAFEREIESTKSQRRKKLVDAWARTWSEIESADTQLEIARLIFPKWQREDVQDAIAANPIAQEILRRGREDGGA